MTQNDIKVDGEGSINITMTTSILTYMTRPRHGEKAAHQPLRDQADEPQEEKHGTEDRIGYLIDLALTVIQRVMMKGRATEDRHPPARPATVARGRPIWTATRPWMRRTALSLALTSPPLRW